MMVIEPTLQQKELSNNILSPFGMGLTHFANKRMGKMAPELKGYIAREVACTGL